MFIKAIMQPMRAGGLGRLRRRRGNSPLGCPGCHPRSLGRLGQDVTDPLSPSYDPLALDPGIPMANAAPYSGPSIDAYPNVIDFPTGQNISSSAYSDPSFHGSYTASGAYTTGALPSQSNLSAGLAAGIASIGAIFKPSNPVVVGASAPAASTASQLNSYLPIIALGLGGIAVLSALKRR